MYMAVSQPGLIGCCELGVGRRYKQAHHGNGQWHPHDRFFSVDVPTTELRCSVSCRAVLGATGRAGQQPGMCHTTSSSRSPTMEMACLEDVERRDTRHRWPRY